jgi:hypothetical protein
MTSVQVHPAGRMPTDKTAALEEVRKYHKFEMLCLLALQKLQLDDHETEVVEQRLSTSRLHRSRCLFMMDMFQECWKCCEHVVEDAVSSVSIKDEASKRRDACRTKLHLMSEQNTCSSSIIPLPLRNVRPLFMDYPLQIDLSRGQNILQPPTRASYTDRLEQKQRHWPKNAKGLLLTGDELIARTMRNCNFIAHARNFCRQWLKQHERTQVSHCMTLKLALYAAPVVDAHPEHGPPINYKAHTMQQLKDEITRRNVEVLQPTLPQPSFTSASCQDLISLPQTSF